MMYDDVDQYPHCIDIQTERATQLMPLLESLFAQGLSLPLGYVTRVDANCLIGGLLLPQPY